jgi:uncharacterized RDD family membrane protein YckC
VTVATRHVVPTNVAPTRGYAGIVTRAVAFALDAALINLAALAVSAVVVLTLSLFPISTTFRDVLIVVGAVLFVLWIVAYFASFWTTTGETPGCHAMRIRVIRTDGSRLRPRHALLRLVGLLLSFPLFWGFVPILFNDRRRGVFDALAGTLVVNSDPPDASLR